MSTALRITDDLEEFFNVLPPYIKNPLQQRPDNSELLEVVLDLGRLPEARYPGREVVLSDKEVTQEDLEYVEQRVSIFGGDNRAGIERTLHRISAIRNRQGRIIGLTCRLGRAVYGTIQVIEDLVQSEKSILLLGRPGVGKTTMLREVARVLADDLNKRVIIVDTSNEIAGDGDIPHPGIGSARRMQVPTPNLQHAVMIEAVENHMPEVIIIDEIGTDLEAAAGRTIAERGVQLVATAHGNTLENLILNPTLADLVGGIQSVTLGDEEARRRGTQKSILERKAPPTFDMVVEIQDFRRVAVHRDVAKTVDAILRGYSVSAEVRELQEDGEVKASAQQPPSRQPSQTAEVVTSQERRASLTTQAATRVLRVYPFGLARGRLDQAIRSIGFPAEISDTLKDSDVVLTLRSHYRRRSQTLRDAEEKGIPVYVLKNNTLFQIEQALVSVRPGRGRDLVASALEEAEEGISQAMSNEETIDLSPQTGYVRRLQHMLAQRYNMTSRSYGREPQRYVRIYPAPGDDVEDE